MNLFKATFQSRASKVAGGVIVLVALVAIFANFLAPTGAYYQNINDLLAKPSWHHLLGTDYLGRDNLSRLILGTRSSLLGALEAVGIGLVLGVIPGLLAVFLPKWPQFLVMRVFDAFMTLPTIVFTIGVVAVIGETQQIAMAAIGILFAPQFFRIVRSATLNFVTSQYVEVAQLFGATRSRIIRTHVWRKVLPTIGVTAANQIGAGILAVSALSYLGIGTQPPLPTWGSMLADDMNYLAPAGWEPIFPGIAIVLVVGALGIIADGLRDATRAGAMTSIAGGAPATVVVPRQAAAIERAIEQVA